MLKTVHRLQNQHSPRGYTRIMLQNNEPTEADQRRLRRRFLIGVLIVGVIVTIAAIALYLTAALSA